MTTILILAAGASRRMGGRDKLAEQVDGVPLLRLQVTRAVATGLRVVVTLPAHPTARAQLLEGLDVVQVPVADAAEGMAASLRAGLAAIDPEGAVLILLADLVEIETADLQAVLDAARTAPELAAWRGATEDGLPGHPILISPTLRPAFMQLEGDTGGAAILRAHQGNTRLVRLPGQRARCDLDTPAAWDAWRKANPGR